MDGWQKFLPSNWYTYDTIHSLRRLTGMLAGAEAGDPQLAVKIGRAMAHHASPVSIARC